MNAGHNASLRAGGVGASGDLNINGQGASNPHNFGVNSEQGGNSFWGGGACGGLHGSTGNTGYFGGGGSGGAQFSNGGAGGAGVVVVYEYS